MLPSIVILIRRGESAAKCSIRPLRGREGLTFLAYPMRKAMDFSGYVLLAPGAPELTVEDAGRPLLLLDASWKHAAAMRRTVEAGSGPLVARSLPGGWRTAYPRKSKIHEDPETGLATVEALYAALCVLGRRDDTWLEFYPFATEFIALNAARLGDGGK